MEITIDLGEDTIESLKSISEIKKSSLTVTAAEMLTFGARIFLQSQEQKEDKNTLLLLENSVRTVEVITELLYIVYDKEKSRSGAYDAETALAVIDRIVSGFRKGVA